MKSPLRLLATLRTFNKQKTLDEWASSELTQDLKAIEDAFKNIGDEFSTSSNELATTTNNLQSQIDAILQQLNSGGGGSSVVALAAGSPGSFAFLERIDNGGIVNFGDVVDGVNLRPAGVQSYGAGSATRLDNPTGTVTGQWRCLGYNAAKLLPDAERGTLFQRIDGIPDVSGEVQNAKEISIDAVLGETASALKAVYIGSDGKAYLATAGGTFSQAQVSGLLKQGGSANQTVKILMFGRIDDPSFSFPLNANLYLSSGGNLTSSDPDSLGLQFNKVVAQSLGVGSIFLNIQKTITL
jgi:hypothetical protein